MKRLFFFLPFFSALLFAEPVDWGDQEPFPTPPSFYPFSLGGSYARVSPAEFYSYKAEGQHLVYQQSDANFAYTQPLSETHGFIFGTGWVGTDIIWDENPAFSETNFNYVNFSAGGFKKLGLNWTWTLNLSAFLDTAYFSLSNYALYQGILWGKYQCNEKVELDVGCLIELGLNQDKVWPVLGCIYKYSDRCRLHAIYPLDMKVEYDVFPMLTAGGAIRILRNRHRVGPHEPQPRSIFIYQTWGIEGDLRFQPAPWFFVNGFLGSTTRGDLTIRNSSDSHGSHYKFRGSFYGGVYSTLSF